MVWRSLVVLASVFVLAACVEPRQLGQVVVLPGASQRLERVCRARGQLTECAQGQPWDEGVDLLNGDAGGQAR